MTTSMTKARSSTVTDAERVSAVALPGGDATVGSLGSRRPAGARRLRAGRPVLLGALGILLFLALWQTVPALGWANPRYLPPATDVLVVFVSNLGLMSFWVALGQTMTAWAIGFAISVVAALVLGFLIGSNRFLREATRSTIEFLRPIPSVALIPLAVLLFGLRLPSELLLIIYACFWIVLIQVLYGVGDVDKVAYDTVRSMRLNAFDRVRHLVWPTTLPYFVTGVRLAATVALILAITAELVVGTPGLGKEVARAQSNSAYAAMYALILASGLVGVLINLIARWAERRLLFWHGSVRAETVL